MKMAIQRFFRRCKRKLTVVADSLYSHSWVAWLGLVNRFRRSQVTAPGGPVVSLTTYGKRIRTVHCTIESIAKGRMLPSRLILWLDDTDAFANLPEPLRRLQRRGLDIRLAKNYGPHTKYYPYLEREDAFATPLVIADDDNLYPNFWLKALVEAFNEFPEFVNCHRARVIAVNETGLGKYADWRLCSSTDPSFRHLATGVSGVIYSPPFLAVLKRAGRGFEACCPKADDLWLHVQALRAGLKVRQIGPQALGFSIIPGTQDMALACLNATYGDGNDQQAKTTYGSEDIDVLRRETAGLGQGAPIRG